MKLSSQIAKHLREVYLGGNWTCSNFREHLTNVTWEQATTQINDFNTIATLVYHCHYYIQTVMKVLKGEGLQGHDEDSFKHPPVSSQQEWEHVLATVWSDVETFASLVEQLPDEKLWENISKEKYGIYYRNLHGIIEHSHYHLGQIVLIKKLMLQKNSV